MRRETREAGGWTGGTHVALRCMVDFPRQVASSLLLGPFWMLDDMRSAEKGFELLDGLGSMAPIEDPDRVYRAALPFYSTMLDRPLPGIRDTGAN